MADEDVAGQLLFDLIAPTRRRPSVFEEAAWVAAAASARSRSAPPDPAAAPPSAGGEEMRSGSAAPDAEERRGGSALSVVGQAEEEPPLVPVASGGGSDAAGPGPRVAAFAAATGAATRSAVVKRQSRPATGARPDTEPEREAPDAPTPRAENHLVPTSSPPPPAPAPARAADPREPAAVAGDATEERTQATIAAATAGAGAVPPAGLPPLENDDDFGPLILVEKPRRRPRSGLWKGTELGAPEDGVPGHPGGSRRSARTGLLLAVALMAVAIVSAWWVVAGRGQLASEAPVAAAPGPDVSMVDWHGMALPVSTTAGPTTFTDTAVGGFGQSALGAAIAAAHLVVRTDPVAGSDVFEPVLANQVVGAKDRLADAVHAQAGQTVEAGTPGTLLGWRLDGDPAAGAVVAHLAVDQADGSRVDFAVPLAWVDGDWRIDAPADGDFFPVSELSGDYTPFTGEATIS